MTEPRGQSLSAEFLALSRNVTSKLNFQNSGITIIGLFFHFYHEKHCGTMAQLAKFIANAEASKQMT